jgi:integrase
MRLLSQEDLIKILPINKTAIERLVTSGKIPYKKITTAEGEIIRFSPDIVSGWIKSGIDLSMDDKKYLERLKKRIEASNPESIKKLKEFSNQFVDPVEPKRFYLERVKSKKLGIVYYVKYLHNGVLVPSHWTTRTNNRELAEKYAVENRERLLSEYFERSTKKSYSEFLSIFRNYYSKDSPYLQIDVKRGRSISEDSRITYNNFINKQFIPYLKKHGVKSIEQIDTPFLTRFQNYLLSDKRKNGKTVAGIKPQTINHYISYISLIFDHLLLEGYVKANPCKSVITIKIKKEDLKITGCYEVNKLKGIFNKKWENEFSYLLCLLMYTTNMRNGEIFRLQLQDLFLIDQYHYINIPESKNQNGVRIVPLHNFVYKKLMSHARKHNKTDYIFKAASKKLSSKVCKRAALELAKYAGYSLEDIKKENIRFYSGRHFWKTLMNSENLGDIEEYFMGHRVSGDIAERYNHRDKQGRKKLLEKTKKVFDILDRKIFTTK